MKLIITNARVIDGTGAEPREGVSLSIVDGKIDQIGEHLAEQPATVLDVGGRTVLPGLIDAHVHLSSLDRKLSQALHPYGLADAAMKMVNAGVTTVRDLGSYGRSLFALREAIREGLCVGPRILLCGQIIAATSPGVEKFHGMYRAADGVYEFRKAVRQQAQRGADFIKVMSTGALTVEDEDVHPAQLTVEEFAALVDEAHRLGFRVASHAEGLDGIRMSVQCHVDTIEHGEMSFSAPELLDQMADRSIILVPTLSVFDWVSESDVFPLWMRDRAKHLGECARKTVAAARHAGVALAMGADAGPHGSNAGELVRMVDAGLTSMEGIIAATSDAARACGIEDMVGSIRPAAAADLLVFETDPLKNVRVFLDAQQLWLVLQNGKPIAGTAFGAHLDH
jgi:imidazolonepropionase-like amidohydrolase